MFVRTHTDAAMCVIVVWSFVRPDGLCSLSASQPRHAKSLCEPYFHCERRLVSINWTPDVGCHVDYQPCMCVCVCRRWAEACSSAAFFPSVTAAAAQRNNLSAAELAVTLNGNSSLL